MYYLKKKIHAFACMRVGNSFANYPIQILYKTKNNKEKDNKI